MVSDLFDANRTTFLPVFVHFGDAYMIPWGSDRFLSFYGPGLLTPVNQYDGLFDSIDLAGDLATRLAVPTDVTIDVIAVEGAPGVWDVSANVCIESGGAGKTLRVYTIQVLDHHATEDWYYRNCLMAAATTHDETVAPGGCVQVDRQFTLDAASQADIGNVKFVAWAQEPLDVGPAEVHQAGQWGYTVFTDGFESGDTTGWSFGSE